MNVCARERERERKREKVFIGGSRLVAVLQRRSRVLLTSPKTKCKLTRRPLDVYSAPRIPPREIRESFSLSFFLSPFNNNRACIFLSLERHRRVLRISLTRLPIRKKERKERETWEFGTNFSA